MLTETTADTVFACIIAASRRLVELSNHVREGCWTRNIGEDLFGWDVHNKTLGILGFGRIGQAVARRAALGFAMPVLFYDPFPVKLPDDLARHATAATFDEVLQRTDCRADPAAIRRNTRPDGRRQFAAMSRRDLRQRLARAHRSGGCARRGAELGTPEPPGWIFATEPPDGIPRARTRSHAIPAYRLGDA